MSATGAALAGLDQFGLTDDGLGGHLIAAVIDGDLDPRERALVRGLVRLWRCGDYAYFGLSPSLALDAAAAVTS